ncbi:Neurotrypsin [Holothuria leucospilota]|uniref:Neurotrypsin n=1 Tax=Holothuria leucospilota TaxID=206669 RepID=A0A9Q1BXI3_HOLLE|nr:Neurotrypsin [Holothuria leucospilota]
MLLRSRRISGGNGIQGIRLIGKTGQPQRVDILHDEKWGTVCGDEEWDLDDARVVCRQLGYHNATNSYKNISGRIVWMSEVQCQGDETYISSCRHQKFQQADRCLIENDAGVRCEGNGLQGIRLVGGSSDSSGRVEVFMNRGWGTICDDGWDMEDAIVVCRQLGYQNATSAPIEEFFGRGSASVCMTDVQCTGNETSLTECTKEERQTYNWRNSYDAGVVCEGKKNTFRLRKLGKCDKETKTP